jgi:hypothetical protein
MEIFPHSALGLGILFWLDSKKDDFMLKVFCAFAVKKNILFVIFHVCMPNLKYKFKGRMVVLSSSFWKSLNRFTSSSLPSDHLSLSHIRSMDSQPP